MTFVMILAVQQECFFFYSSSKDDGEMKLANHASQDIYTTKTLIPFLLMSELGMDLYCMEIGLYWRHEWSKRERVSIYKVYLTSGFYERSEIKATREIYFIYTYE